MMAAAASRPTLAMTDREPVVRSSNADARRRARKLVAVGDRYLRESVTERAKLARALSSYRRAATIAADLPEVYVRQAIALVALDRGDDASRAIATVAAIDLIRMSAGVLITMKAVVPIQHVQAAIGSNLLRDRHEPNIVCRQKIRSRFAAIGALCAFASISGGYTPSAGDSRSCRSSSAFSPSAL